MRLVGPIVTWCPGKLIDPSTQPSTKNGSVPLTSPLITIDGPMVACSIDVAEDPVPDCFSRRLSESQEFSFITLASIPPDRAARDERSPTGCRNRFIGAGKGRH